MEPPGIDAELGLVNGLLEDEVAEEEGGPLRMVDGVLDGGVATDVKGKSEASKCDFILFLECTEAIDNVENHPILAVGVKVMIGLEKTTKLFHVFSRYVEFCNLHAPKDSSPTNSLSLASIEFIHYTVLSEHDTAEASALMKNDHIKVQNNRKEARAQTAEATQMQIESDRIYFEHMRNLMPDFPSSISADIILDCRGKTIGADGLNQEVLRTEIRAHSAILRKRCKWLNGMIQSARDEFDRRSVVSILDQDINIESKEDDSVRMQRFEDEDGIEPVLNYDVNQPNQQESGAAQIENDEDDELVSNNDSSRSGSPVCASSIGRSSLLHVTITNHTPNAVKLLLEYCYTNRVISLGREAFEACSPLPAVARKWPDNGKPKISFLVALAGISIAEEAGLPRLSLMCQMAATILIDSTHDVVEALNLCTSQEKLTGNPLTQLRKSAMALVFRKGPRGVVDICRTPTFRRALDERRNLLVPSLLNGIQELIQDEKVREYIESVELQFDDQDREDKFNRELERRGGRRKDPVLDEEEDHVAAFLDWVSPTQSQRSKRRYDGHVRPNDGEARAQRIVRRKHFGSASFV